MEFIKKIIYLPIVLALFIALAVKVYAADFETIFSSINNDVQAIDTFIYTVEQESESEYFLIALQNGADALQTHLDNSYQTYENLRLNESDVDIANALSTLSSSVNGISNSLTDLTTSIELGDEILYEESIKNIDTNIDNFNSGLAAMNSLLEGESGPDYGPTLGWITLISGVISASLFVMSRGNPILPAEKLRNEFEFALFKSSLWPFGGSLISYVWYLATPPGGTYYMLWWVILIGYIQFGRGLYSYLLHARPAINKAKHEEETNLQQLIISEASINDDLRNKAAEIRKRKGIIEIGK